ncbi:hypothetical protein [Taibaiella koreensis]|uniref:hypothetical protein n=1 Tax=Taibaiella koreensis TaxID=1268548 RepID=UPI000E59E03B|nr:hypothetical protein [Taibaiella koreensis]
MKVQNPQSKPLQEVLSRLASKYPGAEIKKPFLTPRTIIAPSDNFKFLVRDRSQFFKVDFTPPVLWIIAAIVLSSVMVSAILSLIYGQFVFGFGGVLWILLSLVIVKAIFKSRNKAKFDAFYADLQHAVNSSDDSSQIF